MTSQGKPSRPPTRGAQGRTARERATGGVRPTVWLLVAGAAALALASFLAWPRVEPEPVPTRVVAGGPGPSDAAPAPRPPQDLVPTQVLERPGREEAPEPPPTAEPPVPEGIQAFPPLGTNPPKAGIIVPEDFEVPPGYVRHLQVTDDGRQLKPILMYHPDRPPVDARGEPIEVPEDRVVRPEDAPPGLPIEILEVPETQLPPVEIPEGFSWEDLER